MVAFDKLLSDLNLRIIDITITNLSSGLHGKSSHIIVFKLLNLKSQNGLSIHGSQVIYSFQIAIISKCLALCCSTAQILNKDSVSPGFTALIC